METTTFAQLLYRINDDFHQSLCCRRSLCSGMIKKTKDQLTVISDKKLQPTREFKRFLFHHDYKNKIDINTEIARTKHRERMVSIVVES